MQRDRRKVCHAPCAFCIIRLRVINSEILVLLVLYSSRLRTKIVKYLCTRTLDCCIFKINGYRNGNFSLSTLANPFDHVVYPHSQIFWLSENFVVVTNPLFDLRRIGYLFPGLFQLGDSCSSYRKKIYANSHLNILQLH